eukprot:684841-Pelagomonas_calceolata.AAC.4
MGEHQVCVAESMLMTIAAPVDRPQEGKHCRSGTFTEPDTENAECTAHIPDLEIGSTMILLPATRTESPTWSHIVLSSRRGPRC